MGRPRVIPWLFLLAGTGSIPVALVAHGPDYGPIDAGQPELATAFVVVGGLGLAVTGVVWCFEAGTIDVDYRRLPGLTLVLLGASAIAGATVVFRFWEYGGLAYGFLGMIWLALVVVGLLFVQGGRRWARQGRLRQPLAVLSGCQALAVFYAVHQRMDLHVPIPELVLVVAVIVATPIVAVFYGLRGMERPVDR